MYSLYRRKGEDVSISIKVENHKWDELDFWARNTVHVFSAKNIFDQGREPQMRWTRFLSSNVHGMSSTKEL